MATKTLPPGTPIPADTLYEVVDGQIVVQDDELPGNGLPGDILYEVIDGKIVELAPMGAFEVDIASLIHTYMNYYAIQNRMGRAESEMMFVLDAAAGRKRRPDVAFVSYGRWPRKKRVPRTEAWAVIPELAVEVVSPTNTAAEVLTKIREYFQAGCKRVWVVYPTEEQIYVYLSPTQNHILTRHDELDGEDFLPGFRLPLATLFEADEE